MQVGISAGNFCSGLNVAAYLFLMICLNTLPCVDEIKSDHKGKNHGSYCQLIGLFM